MVKGKQFSAPNDPVHTASLLGMERAGLSQESMRSSNRGNLAGQATQSPLIREARLLLAPTSQLCRKLSACGWHSVRAGTLFYTFEHVPLNLTAL